MDAAKIERVYSRYAKIYDHIFGKIFHAGRELAVQQLNLSPGERVLEVGVGTGLSLPFYPSFCEIFGVDLSDGMLAQCRDRMKKLGLPHVQVLRMDAGSMEFPDNSFDAVMAAYVVTAVPDYQKVMREMVRVCRPGGRIILLNHFSNGNPIVAAIEKIISPFCKRLGWRTDLSLETVLENTRLTIIHKQGVNAFDFWHLVKCVNHKSINGHSHQEHAANGSPVSTSSPVFASEMPHAS